MNMVTVLVFLAGLMLGHLNGLFVLTLCHIARAADAG